MLVQSWLKAFIVACSLTTLNSPFAWSFQSGADGKNAPAKQNAASEKKKPSGPPKDPSKGEDLFGSNRPAIASEPGGGFEGEGGDPFGGPAAGEDPFGGPGAGGPGAGMDEDDHFAENSSSDILAERYRGVIQVEWEIKLDGITVDSDKTLALLVARTPIGPPATPSAIGYGGSGAGGMGGGGMGIYERFQVVFPTNSRSDGNDPLDLKNLTERGRVLKYQFKLSVPNIAPKNSYGFVSIEVDNGNSVVQKDGLTLVTAEGYVQLSAFNAEPFRFRRKDSSQSDAFETKRAFVASPHEITTLSSEFENILLNRSNGGINPIYEGKMIIGSEGFLGFVTKDDSNRLTLATKRSILQLFQETTWKKPSPDIAQSSMYSPGAGIGVPGMVPPGAGAGGRGMGAAGGGMPGGMSGPPSGAAMGASGGGEKNSALGDSRLEEQMTAAIVRYTSASSNDAAKAAREELKTLLESQFDAQRKVRALEILEFQERLGRLQVAEAEKRNKKNEIIEARLQQLLPATGD